MRNETQYTLQVLSIGVLAALVLDSFAMAQQSGTARPIVFARGRQAGDPNAE